MKNSSFKQILKKILISELIAGAIITASFNNAKANGPSDSLTLIQCYINLSLTNTYFDTLTSNRIEKIVPYIEGEMKSIKDKNFIAENKTLYNITWSYLHFLKSRFLFRTKKAINRTVLLNCKNELNQAITYFNAAEIYKVPWDDWDNSFYDFGEFTRESCISLSTSISNLKLQYNPYFSRDISSGLQRVFFTTHIQKMFQYDSLKYYTGLYNIPAGYRGDSLTLAQSYVNLSYTGTYFDTLTPNRISDIIRSAEGELAKIKDTAFIKLNNALYNLTYSNLYLLKTKLSYRNKSEINRLVLLNWKETLHKSHIYFGDARVSWYETNEKLNTFYNPVKYDWETCNLLSDSIKKYKSKFSPLFSKDIYPDFQRLFYSAKDRNEFHFDSLEYYTSLYTFPIRFQILGNLNINPYTRLKSVENNISDGYEYKLPLALDLISRYLQLSYIVEKASSVKNITSLYYNYSDFVKDLKPDDSFNFNESSEIPKDNFFRKELDTVACNMLYSKLEKKFPYKIEADEEYDSDKDGVGNMMDMEGKYYFPIPVPFPSSKISINHFHPELKTMKQTDNYIKKCFIDAGYTGRLHYFYIQDSGFAMTTGIEKIKKNGSPASPDERWNLTISNNGNISLYQIFKSIFFATESDYRMISCIIAPHEVKVSKKSFSINQMNNLIQNSYSSLPTDLENLILPDKTLTILVYHFYQSDVGEVPLLDTKEKLTVQNHLVNTSALARLLN